MSQQREQLLQAVMEKMASVMRGLHAGQGFAFGELTLGPPHVRILFCIARADEAVSVKDLAEMLGVTSGAVTQFVDALVEKDLVRREEDPKDRRILRIRLTQAAADTFGQFRESYLAQIGRSFDALSDDELTQLIGLLAKVSVPVASKGYHKLTSASLEDRHGTRNPS